MVKLYFFSSCSLVNDVNDDVEVFCKLKMKHKFLPFEFESILLTLNLENSINIGSIPIFFCISFLSSYIVLVV